MSERCTVLMMSALSAPAFNARDTVLIRPETHRHACIGTVIGLKWDTDCPCPDKGWHYQVAVVPVENEQLAAKQDGPRAVDTDRYNIIYVAEARVTAVSKETLDEIHGIRRRSVQ